MNIRKIKIFTITTPYSLPKHLIEFAIKSKVTYYRVENEERFRDYCSKLGLDIYFYRNDIGETET